MIISIFQIVETDDELGEQTETDEAEDKQEAQLFSVLHKVEPVVKVREVCAFWRLLWLSFCCYCYFVIVVLFSACVYVCRNLWNENASSWNLL